MTQKNSVTFSSRPNHAARAAHMQARQMFSEYDTSQITPKKSKLPLVFGSLAAIVVVLAIVALVMHFFVDSGNESNDLLPQDQTAGITVVAGDDATLIAAELKRVGLIADIAPFVQRVKARGAESTLQVGSYTIAGGTSIDGIIDILQQGPGVGGMALLVTEGMRLSAIARAVETATAGAVTAEAFTEAAVASRWASEFAFTAQAGDASLEGMLFPATYSLMPGQTADDLVRMMLRKFQSEIKALDLSVAEQAGLSWYDWLKLASIVQAETTAGDEAKVASAFYNRLAADMPLQSDATTAYSVGGVPTAAQLADYDDPYNTYSYDRLGVCIPTPIGNPGLAALEAAAAPAKTDYLYFYAMEQNGEMVTVFSATYEEHLAVIESDR